MIKLAASSGTVIYEDENKLYLFKQPAKWTTLALFITGLLAFILIANGLLQLIVIDNRSPYKELVGSILLAAGILFALICWRVFIYRKKINAKDFTELKCICIIDLTNNTLQDEHRNTIASLVGVHLQHKMQFTSSSSSLILTWNRNELIVVEGNPFAGGIDAVEKVLTTKGIKKR